MEFLPATVQRQPAEVEQALRAAGASGRRTGLRRRGPGPRSRAGVEPW